MCLCLVMIELGDDAVIYVDCEERRLVMKVLQDNDSSRRLRIISFGTGKPRKTRRSRRELRITSIGHKRLRR